jgi:hypothetical protein
MQVNTGTKSHVATSVTQKGTPDSFSRNNLFFKELSSHMKKGLAGTE